MKLRSFAVVLMVACVSLAVGKWYVDSQTKLTIERIKKSEDAARTIFSSHGVELYATAKEEAEARGKASR